LRPAFGAGRGFMLAGAEGFEPPSPVLETGSLAVELTPLNAAISFQLSALSFQLDPAGVDDFIFPTP
jgi:hypothetical protein